MGIIAKLGVIGDTHLLDKNYGGHNNYPAESLEYFQTITKKTEELGLTHLIGEGDLTFGRFSKLEYREAIEIELEKQNKLTNGNRYEIKGNHDSATNGMTEYEYYTRKGLLKTATNLTVGNLHVTMLDYINDGRYTPEMMNISLEPNQINVAIAHQYFKFKDTRIPNFGAAIELDEFTPFFGLDKLICGHVHHIMNFEGLINANGMQRKCEVSYTGCMMRPAYREGFMDEVGQIHIITVHDNGNVEFDTEIIQLWALEKSFNLTLKAAEKEKKVEKESRIDISDVVKQLDSHDRNIGNPEDIIADMKGIDDKYKNKAIELLKNAI